jgi:predicted transcriptional regulator YheO
MLANEIKKYSLWIEAMLDMFHPFLEIAVHDLKTGKLAMLYNNLSKRKVGDASVIPDLVNQTAKFPDYFPPYHKLNFDGRPLKCTSITIRDAKEKPIGLICLNFNLAPFVGMQEQLNQLMKTKEAAESPVEKFGGDTSKIIAAAVDQYLRDEKLAVEGMTRYEKKKLVRHLYRQGFFNYKNANVVICKRLGVSRASLYNYIK